MGTNWIFFFLLIVLCFCVQGFFSMMEMACVSFNRVRLEGFFMRDKRWLKSLRHLLKAPTYLFGTTLIGVNISLQFGSECARRLYALWGLDPDWALLSQPFIVLLFAELAPMMAARRHPSHVVRLGVVPLYLLSLLMTPFVRLFALLSEGMRRLMGSPPAKVGFLTREELKWTLLGTSKESKGGDKSVLGEFELLIENIFSLEKRKIKEVMIPLSQLEMIPSQYTMKQLQEKLKSQYVDYVPLYRREKSHIVGILYPRDLLRLSENTPLASYARPPWFITENHTVKEALEQFCSNKQRYGVVLDAMGRAKGVIPLDLLVDELFGGSSSYLPQEKTQRFIDRSFPFTMSLTTLKSSFGVDFLSSLPQSHSKEKETLDRESGEGVEEENSKLPKTLGELMIHHLGHSPGQGESVKVGELLLTLEKPSSTSEGKVITVRTCL